MKLKKIAMFSLSIIYSMNAFSIEEKITEGDIILLENTYLNDNSINSTSLASPPKKNKITRPIFDEFVSDIYIYHNTDVRNSDNLSSKKFVEVIRITDEIISRMNEEIKKTIPTKSIDIEKILITDNPHNNRVLDLDNTNTAFKAAVLDYLANFSSHIDTPIFIQNSNERITFNKNKIDNLTNSRIEIQRHYQPDSKLNESGKNIEIGMKLPPHSNEIIFKLEDSFAEKITALEEKQEENNQERSRNDNLLDEKIHRTITKLDSYIDERNDNNKDIIDNKNDINENKKQISTIKLSSDINRVNIEENKTTIKTNKDNININKNKIDENTGAIDESRITIIKNTNNITENTLQINDIKENTINGVDINGVKLPLKNHLSHLYNQQSIGRSQFNALKENFEHFKSDTQNRFYKVEKRANQGIASVAAMSNLPFTDDATFSTAIGIGNYRNATALAWGMQYRINENIKVRASTAWNESNSWVSAGGVGISW